MIQEIDLKLKRLLLNLDVKEDILNPDLEPNPKLVHVCPEQYQGTLFGYPLYKSGFVSQNCDISFEPSKLVTIVYNFVNMEHVLDEDHVIQIIKQTIQTYPGVTIKIGTMLEIKTVFFFNFEKTLALFSFQPQNFKFQDLVLTLNS